MVHALHRFAMTGILVAALGACVPGVILSACSAAASRNTLALGGDALVDDLDIDIQPPAELDFLSRNEVLELRSRAVDIHPELLAAEYSPSRAVFGGIVGGLPWWGIEGEALYGRGEDSISGASEESRFILNPFLLVGADFYENWQGRIVESDPGSIELVCLPESLHWQPAARRAEVTYSAACTAQMSPVFFHLVGYNARDFGMEYIHVSYTHSMNISKENMTSSIVRNPQYLHAGSSCGYPGGCNNLSPAVPELTSLTVTGFPARVETWLWEEQPESVSQAADMIFVILIR